MFSRLPLTALRAFESAARLKSFKQAASELSVTPSAVSHQVKTLEEWIGKKLFDRCPSGISLTPEGLSLFDEVHSYFLKLDSTLEVYRPRSDSISICVTTTPAFAALWLIPRLGGFYDKHPGIRVQIEASNGIVDLLRDSSIDLAIRSTRKVYQDLYSVTLLDERFGVFVAPNHSFNDSTPHLINVAWEPPESAIAHWHHWRERAMTSDWLEGSRILDYADEHYALHAAIAGQGYILASTVLAEDSVRRGLLAPYRPEVSLDGLPYMVLCKPGRERNMAVKAFMNWVLQEADGF